MVLARFLPRDERFFDYFHDAVSNALDVAQLLVELFEHYEDVGTKVRRMRELEHRGDEITHQIFSALNRTFVTPFDREDISTLASHDRRFRRLRRGGRAGACGSIASTGRPSRRRCSPGSSCDQARAIAEAVGFLSDMKQRDKMLRVVVDINRLEDEADDVLNHALAVLYDGATDIPSLIKAIRWGELYSDLEVATDRGEDVANTLEGIVSSMPDTALLIAHPRHRPGARLRLHQRLPRHRERDRHLGGDARPLAGAGRRDGRHASTSSARSPAPPWPPPSARGSSPPED